MSNVRRVKIGDKKYRVLPLKHYHKGILRKNQMEAYNWLLLNENEEYIIVVHKETLESNPIVKRVPKYRRMIK